MSSRMSAVITLMKDGTIIDTDSNSSKLFGYSLQELMGFSLWSLTPEPYSQAIEPMMSILMNKNSASNWDGSRAYEGKRKDNSLFPMQISFSSIGDEIFMATVDTIDRVTGSLTVNAEGKIVFATNEQELFGYPSAEILHQNISKILCASEGIPLPVDSILNLTPQEELEVLGLHQNGTSIPLNLRVPEIINLGNTKLFRLQMEKIDYSNEACLLVDTSETILACSHHFIKPLYGERAEALVGLKMSSAFKEETIQYTNTGKNEEGERSSKRRRNTSLVPFRFLENSRSWEENTIYQYLAQLKRKDGLLVSVRFRVLPFTNKDGTKLFSVRVSRLVGPVKLAPEKDKLIGDQYQVNEVIGEGAFGKVKMGEDKDSHKKVAIKILNLKMMKPADVELARREIKILKQIEHPNIVKLLNVYETPNRLYLVQEHAGVDLHSYVLQRGKLSEEETTKIFSQLCDAVEYCHNHGIIHRDIKPNNILLDDSGVARLIDFGVSNFSSEEEMRGTYCGTTACAPPEMILGKKYQGTKVDVWTMGVLLYFMLTGNMPFPDIASILSAQFVPPEGVSKNCIDVLQNMLELDVDKRAKLVDISNHPWLGKPKTFIMDGKLEETNSGSSK